MGTHFLPLTQRAPDYRTNAYRTDSAHSRSDPNADYLSHRLITFVHGLDYFSSCILVPIHHRLIVIGLKEKNYKSIEIWAT